jgi:solute carrier family 35 protein E1
MAPKDDKKDAAAPTNYLMLGLLFIVWYAFNAGYNVYNSKIKSIATPWAISCAQLAVGLLYALPLWVLGIRKIPKIGFGDLMKLLPIAILNAFGHACAVIAMFEKGGGSFTHVIKASEPVVSTILAVFISGVIPQPFTALSLLPITYGVAYAATLGNLSPAEMSTQLTTKAAMYAMGSNVSFSLRSILKKGLSKDFKEKTNLDTPQNEHAVATLLSTILTLPFVFYFEGYDKIMAAYNNPALVPDQQTFLMNVVICGMCYYMYNDFQNIVLGSLGAVPTAVGNTLKRVAIFVALYLFTTGESFPMPKVIGCAIAVSGCLVYAICHSKHL